ncbi:MAG: hypothetical protein CM15mP58_08260 [Burkholderiaceae bacterium]|nr:MAG: hypothetical protein CM15mP58_08260 [Burkholderiaceae bacterium]
MYPLAFKRIFENCFLKIISSGDHVIPINNQPDYFKFIERYYVNLNIKEGNKII